MKRFAKEYLLENWTLKATSLLLALILWLFVRGEPGGPERVVSVPLEVQLPRLMEITNERPNTVEVTLRGAMNTWFNQPLPTCVVDLQGYGEGRHVIPLTPETVRTAKGSGIEVMQVTPARVTLVLERTISREVPITVPVAGEPPDGYELYRKFVRPSSVIVTGPRTHIERVAEVTTDPVSLEGLTQMSRSFVNLNIEDHFIRSSLTNAVQVEVHIGPTRKLTTIRNVPVFLDDPATYTAKPKQISVQVLAPVEWIPGITSADVSATIATGDINASRFPARVKPQVKFLNNQNGHVLIRNIEPAEVLVERKSTAY
ncbi:MAG: hypothetical protein GXX84_14945 [Acidobacteria bacterium]|mgnify:CR=1 FL=1|nr:hypothetical protein [Acidobacteriota bacterium]